MGKRKEWTDKEIDEVVRLYKNGESFASIGREIGRVNGSVKAKLNSLGYNKVNKKYYRVNAIYLWDVDEVRKHIVDIEESKVTAHKSNKKIKFKCGNDGCTNTKMGTPQNIVRQGYSCPNCSTNISYGERLVLSLNQYFDLGLEYQKRLPNLNLIFDFVDYQNKVVYEIQGLQHFEETEFFGGAKKFKEIKVSDQTKRKYCKENNWSYVTIDARKSDFYFIKTDIDKCEYLPNMLPKDEKPIMELIEISSKYPIKEITKLYEVDKLTKYEIAKKFNVSKETIHSLLLRNGIGIKNEKTRVVKCIETDKIYSSMTDASKQTGAVIGHIGSCCKGKRKTAGGYHWEFVTEE